MSKAFSEYARTLALGPRAHAAGQAGGAGLVQPLSDLPAEFEISGFGQAADVGRDAFDYASERNSEEIKRRDAPLSTAVAPRGSNGCNDGGGDLLGGIGTLRRP